VDVHNLIAAAVWNIEIRHTLISHDNLCAGLRSGRDLQNLGSIDGRNQYLSAKCSHREAHRLLDVDVDAVSNQLFVRLDLYDDVEIAERSAARSLVAISADAHACTICDTGWNLKIVLFAFSGQTISAAVTARLFNLLARAFAVRARGDLICLHEEH